MVRFKLYSSVFVFLFIINLVNAKNTVVRSQMQIVHPVVCESVIESTAVAFV